MASKAKPDNLKVNEVSMDILGLAVSVVGIAFKDLILLLRLLCQEVIPANYSLTFGILPACGHNSKARGATLFYSLWSFLSA
jgi:hypothetical protein